MVSNKDIKMRLNARREGKVIPKSERIKELYLTECPDCGAENTEEYKFCFNCGSQLNEVESSNDNYGYMVCNLCYGVHKLHENDNFEDYKICQCGGNYTHVANIDDIDAPSKKCEFCNFANSYFAESCSECGKEFHEYLLYIETKRQDIEICEDKIIVYNKLNKAINRTDQYDLDKIVNLVFTKGVYKYDIEFDYGRSHVKLQVTEKQGNYVKKLFAEWKPPIVSCPNKKCISFSFIKEGEICTNCGTKAEKYPYESYDRLKSIVNEKQIIKQEIIRNENEKRKEQRRAGLKRDEDIKNEKIDKERSRYGFLKEAIGVDGKIELFPHKIRIKKGFMALKGTKPKSDKEILLNQISSIKFIKATINKSGFIKFAFTGGDESKKGLFEAPHEENIIKFNQKQLPAFQQIKDMIEAQMIIQHQPITGKTEKTETTNFYEIEKLAELREKGIISDIEFEAKKRQILGL